MFSSRARQHAQNLITKKFYAVLMLRTSLLPHAYYCVPALAPQQLPIF
jgi:hypothetical protein